MISNVNKKDYPTKNKKISLIIGTLNIISVRGNRLELACSTLQKKNVDIAILTETKLNGFHTVNSFGYQIWASKCNNINQGGIALVHKESDNWHLEGIKMINQNILQGTLIFGNKRFNIIGTYSPPSNSMI